MSSLKYSPRVASIILASALLTGCGKSERVVPVVDNGFMGSGIALEELIRQEKEYYSMKANTAFREDAKLLAKLAYAECAQGNETDFRYVIESVVNRVESSRYPQTIRDVIFQKNAYESVNGKLWKSVEKKALNSEDFGVYGKCYDVAVDVLKEGAKTDIDRFHAGSPVKRPRDRFWNGSEIVAYTGAQTYYKLAKKL